jgi:hypothetical protein
MFFYAFGAFDEMTVLRRPEPWEALSWHAHQRPFTPSGRARYACGMFFYAFGAFALLLITRRYLTTPKKQRYLSLYF